jgi:hypothetical protein
VGTAKELELSDYPKEVTVPRDMFYHFYREWLSNHGCMSEFCACIEVIAIAQSILGQRESDV